MSIAVSVLEKKCTRCEKVKIVDEFDRHPTHITGRNPRCKSCRRQYYQKTKVERALTQRRSREKKIKMLRESKDVPCVDCDQRYPYYVMDFDHISGEKNSVVSRIVVEGSIKALAREILKCEVVCSNCHRIRTHKRKTFESTPTSS